MPVPTFVAGSATASQPSTGTAHAVSQSVATEVGHLVVMTIVIRHSVASVVSAPDATWTRWWRVTPGSGTISMETWAKIADVAGLASHTFTLTASQPSVMQIVNLTGVDAAAPLDVAEGFANVGTGTTNTHPGITTTGIDRYIMTVYGSGSAVNTTTTFGVERWNQFAGTGTSARSTAGYEETQAAAGATGSRVGTLPGGGWLHSGMAAIKGSGPTDITPPAAPTGLTAVKSVA